MNKKKGVSKKTIDCKIKGGNKEARYKDQNNDGQNSSKNQQNGSCVETRMENKCL